MPRKMALPSSTSSGLLIRSPYERREAGKLSKPASLAAEVVFLIWDLSEDDMMLVCVVSWLDVYCFKLMVVCGRVAKNSELLMRGWEL